MDIKSEPQMNVTYETQQLTLRICTRKDAALVLDFYRRNIDDFSKYEPITLPAALTLKFHADMLDYEYQAFVEGTSIRYYFFRKGDPFTIVGTMSFRGISGGYYSVCQLGYKVDIGYRRRGYAREALALGVEAVHRERGIHRIEAVVLPDNDPSMRLLEGLGFVREGLIRDRILLNNEWRDHYMYSHIEGRTG